MIRATYGQSHESASGMPEKKDRLEFVLYKMVCAQEISLAEAQHAMATNWIEAWKQYVPSHQHYRFKRVD